VSGTGINIFFTENQHSKMVTRAFEKFGFLANMAHKMAIYSGKSSPVFSKLGHVHVPLQIPNSSNPRPAVAHTNSLSAVVPMAELFNPYKCVKQIPCATTNLLEVHNFKIPFDKKSLPYDQDLPP
jgi:hypothetical protein